MSSTDEVLAEGRKKLGIRTNKLKNNKASKEGGNMKKFIKNNWKIAFAVIVTLGLVAGSYKIFYMGVNYEASKQQHINQKVEAAVKQVSVETSKQ